MTENENIKKIHGPYYRSDGRRHIVIVYENGRKQTKSYPKYLLEQKIGRELEENETCDHVDEDFTNDDLNNLQVFTRSENAVKAMIGREQKIYKFICPVCKKESEKPMKDVSNNWKMGKKGPVCSKQCVGFVGKEFIRYRTAYEYDSVNKQLTITEESWELP